MQVAEHLQGLVHTRGLRRRLVAVVEPPASRCVQEDLLIRTTECARPQRRHDGYLVRRIVDRVENRRELPNLCTIEERLPTLGAVRDRELRECRLECLEARTGRHQYGDIAPA